MAEDQDFSAVPFKEYVDSQLAEVRRAVVVAAATPDPAVPLREYVEAIFEEQRRGLIVAESEREKAARALAEEREKAAQALAVELQRAITEGDRNLRERTDEQGRNLTQHIDEQGAQLRQLIESVQREQNIRHNAAQEAIKKAEDATERRLESLNELRGSMADQTNTFLPREVAEAQLLEMRRAIADLTEKVNRLV